MCLSGSRWSAPTIGLIAAHADVLHRLGRPASRPALRAAAKSADPARTFTARTVLRRPAPWPRAVALWELARASEPQHQPRSPWRWEVSGPRAARRARCGTRHPARPGILRQVNSAPAE